MSFWNVEYGLSTSTNVEHKAENTKFCCQIHKRHRTLFTMNDKMFVMTKAPLLFAYTHTHAHNSTTPRAQWGSHHRQHHHLFLSFFPSVSSKISSSSSSWLDFYRVQVQKLEPVSTLCNVLRSKCGYEKSKIHTQSHSITSIICGLASFFEYFYIFLMLLCYIYTRLTRANIYRSISVQKICFKSSIPWCGWLFETNNLTLTHLDPNTGINFQWERFLICGRSHINVDALIFWGQTQATTHPIRPIIQADVHHLLF